MGNTGITLSVKLTGLRAGLDRIKRLDKEASARLRDASATIATTLAAAAKLNASSAGGQARLMAATVKVGRDRVPVITAGGAKRVGRHRVPAYKLLGGSEFGSNRLSQFRPFKKDGYWFFPIADEWRGYADRQWNRAVDEIAREFEAGR